MVLVGNKCDLQAWAVDMNQARDVSESKNLLSFRSFHRKFSPSTGGQAVWRAVRWNLREDPHGRWRCILHAGTRDSQGQGTREKEQRQARNRWQPEPTIPMRAAVKKRPHIHIHTLTRHAHAYTKTHLGREPNRRLAKLSSIIFLIPLLFSKLLLLISND